jgi:DNA-binding NtrC family response regulator
MARVLVADDERSICEAFSSLLAAEGHEALVASSGTEALRMVRDEAPDAVFLDVRMPGLDGLAVLREIARSDPSLPVIIMTAWGTLETAAAALGSNAFDYLGKPLDIGQLRAVLARALHRPAARTRSVGVVPEVDARPALVGQSRPMQEIFKHIVLLAGNDLNVLVLGDSGTGKELVARAIHDRGPRRDEPFVAVNCAAIPEQLIESELFGHVRGAFTDAREGRIGRFEAAGRGTLFLDEITELPLHVQGKLLRVLQERSYERVGSVTPMAFTARLIAATNRDLAAEVEAGRFREDLFHRLDLASLRLPPLRERTEDIPELAAALLARANREVGKRLEGIEHDALQRLASQDWPGNVRQLEHVIKRSVLTARGPLLSVHDLRFEEAAGSGSSASGSGIESPLTHLREAATQVVEAARDEGVSGDVHRRIVEAAEMAAIGAALRLSAGNQVQAARLLGIHRSTLRSKLGDADETS